MRTMSTLFLRAGLSVHFLTMFLATVSLAAPAGGERELTPNQQRRIVQVNQDLPKDIVDQPRDSRRVAELREKLRKTLAVYRQTVKHYGSGTAQTRAAAHQIMEAQQALHKQFITEEATPAIPTAAR
jgi:hypothetical protein